MAEYRKYLFDNFVISSKKKEEPVEVSAVEGGKTETDVKPEDVLISEESDKQVVGSENVVGIEPQEIEENNYEISRPETFYTQDDLDEAVQNARNEGYTQGLMAAQEQEEARQNELLSEIKNQLGVVFADMEKQSENEEMTMLRFIVSCLRKLMPTLEKMQNVPEIKKFLEDNFAVVSNQKMLAFFFAPDTIKSAAPLIEKVATQHDFEGKISVHKDESLGSSDCRIEWKDGHIERNVDKLLDKIDEMLSNNQQERENG